MEFGDLYKVDGARNMGSIGTLVRYALVSDFDTNGIPAIAAENADFDAVAVVAGNFTFKTGKGWKKIRITQDAGSLNCENQGERDGISYANTLRFLHPGNKAAALGLHAKFANTDLIFLVVDAEGQKRIVGSEQFPANMITGGANTGEGAADRKGVQFEFVAHSPIPAPIFTGTQGSDESDLSAS